MKKKLLRALAAVVLGVSLSAGMAAAQTGTIDTTGPDSNNQVTFENDTDVDVDNDTDIDVDARNDQDADSGDAEVEGNTTGGDATSGAATNSHSLTVRGTVDNTSSNSAALAWAGGGGDDSGSIDNTGPDSNNQVTFNNSVDVDVDNDTDIDVDVRNDQDADSGDAEVEHNTTGGDATSGDASNTSSVVIEFDVSN